MGSLFIPVIPTHSANLAGTAPSWPSGGSARAWRPSGLPVWASNLYKFNNSMLVPNGVNVFDLRRRLLKKFGGFVEGQYYFTIMVRQRRLWRQQGLTA